MEMMNMDTKKNTQSGFQFFDDQGETISPNNISIPELCLSCKKYFNEDVIEKMTCTMTRYDQKSEAVFLCFGYTPSSLSVDKASVLRGLCEKAGVVYPEDTADSEDTDAVRF